MAKIGVRRETKSPWERRVAVTPDLAARLVAAGHEVLVERAERRVFPDADYAAQGATLVDDLPTCAELVDRIEERVGKKAILDQRPDQPGDVPITYADVSKAERDLGYKPEVRIEEGLDRFMRWYRESSSVREDA